MREENEQEIKDRQARRAVRMALYDIAKRVAKGENVPKEKAQYAVNMAKGEIA